MAGNRFTKKLQSIKSRMMMDDVPVDPSRRKLFTLPPEETSQSLPVPQTQQPLASSNLTDKVLNEPMDRRGFLNKTAQTARNVAAQRMLPSLSPLAKLIQEAPEVIKQVEPPPPSIASTLQKQINDFLEGNFFIDDLEDQYSIYQNLSKALSRNDRKSLSLSYGPIMSKVKNALKGKVDDEEEIDELLLYIGDLNKQIVNGLDENKALNVLFNFKDQSDELEDFHEADLSKILFENKHPPSQIHEFLDANYPYYDEEVVNEVLEDLAKKKSE